MKRLHFRSLQGNKQKGFTIVELMISMSVFAVILLVVVSVFIQISKLYTKGVTVSRTQESARSLLDEITRDIQFSTSPVIRDPITPNYGNALNYYCIGDKRYSFKLNMLKADTDGGSQAVHVMQKDTVATNGGCPPAVLGAQGAIANATELMIDNTSLTDLDITCPDQVLCTIRLRMVYGDPGDDSLFMDEGSPTRRVCRAGIVGAEFCTVVELTASVTRRLQ